MKQYHVVRRFGDGDLILEHGFGLGIQIAGLLRQLNGMVQLANTVFIFVGAAQRRVISRNAFQRMARFEQVKLGFRVIGEQFHQRVAKALPQAALHEGSAALATKQQSLRFETLNRLAQGGTGDVELFCQFTFRWEFFSGTQCSLKD